MGQKSFRKNRWPYILTAYYQTLTSVSVKHGQNSPRLGLTNQPRKSRDVKREPLKLLLAPRPVAGAVRPVVQCCTFRYNAKQRIGRGFTWEEVKNAGLCATQAKQLGICIDKRRRNKSAENLQRNVQRLKEYKQKLVMVPKNATTDVEQVLAQKIMPLSNAKAAVSAEKITEDMKKGSVYQAFHMAKANTKYAGQREKRRKIREAEEAEKKSRKK